MQPDAAGTRLQATAPCRNSAAPIRQEGGRPNQVDLSFTLKDRKGDQPNPFVVAQGTVQRFLTMLGDCALACKARIEA